MSKIVINRTDEFVNGMRDYQILFDGVVVGTVANGETKEFPVPSGQYAVSAKIDWCGSPTLLVVVDEGDVKILQVGAFKVNKWLLIIGFVFFVLYALITRTFDYQGLSFILFLVTAQLLYVLTFGHKKYLTLKELVIRN